MCVCVCVHVWACMCVDVCVCACEHVWACMCVFPLVLNDKYTMLAQKIINGTTVGNTVINNYLKVCEVHINTTYFLVVSSAEL